MDLIAGSDDIGEARLEAGEDRQPDDEGAHRHHDRVRDRPPGEASGAEQRPPGALDDGAERIEEDEVAQAGRHRLDRVRHRAQVQEQRREHRRDVVDVAVGHGERGRAPARCPSPARPRAAATRAGAGSGGSSSIP